MCEISIRVTRAGCKCANHWDDFFCISLTENEQTNQSIGEFKGFTDAPLVGSVHFGVKVGTDQVMKKKNLKDVLAHARDMARESKQGSRAGAETSFVFFFFHYFFGAAFVFQKQSIVEQKAKTRKLIKLLKGSKRHKHDVALKRPSIIPGISLSNHLMIILRCPLQFLF